MDYKITKKELPNCWQDENGVAFEKLCGVVLLREMYSIEKDMCFHLKLYF